VNGVAPGPVWTPLQVSGGASHEKLQKFGSQTVFGRPGQPAELASITFNSLMPLPARHWASVRFVGRRVPAVTRVGCVKSSKLMDRESSDLIRLISANYFIFYAAPLLPGKRLTTIQPQNRMSGRSANWTKATCRKRETFVVVGIAYKGTKFKRNH